MSHETVTSMDLPPVIPELAGVPLPDAPWSIDGTRPVRRDRAIAA